MTTNFQIAVKRIKDAAQNKTAQVLDLGNLRLGVIPNEFERANLSHIKKLIIRENDLKVLPEKIKTMTNLILLDLSSNDLSIEAINDAVENLRNLKYLWILGSTRITCFPERIAYLENLEELSLAETQIEFIPDSIKNLKKLEVIFINNTKLRELPPSLMLLTQKYELRSVFAFDTPATVTNNGVCSLVGKHRIIDFIENTDKNKIRSSIETNLEAFKRLHPTEHHYKHCQNDDCKYIRHSLKLTIATYRELYYGKMAMDYDLEPRQVELIIYFSFNLNDTQVKHLSE